MFSGEDNSSQPSCSFIKQNIPSSYVYVRKIQVQTKHVTLSECNQEDGDGKTRFPGCVSKIHAYKEATRNRKYIINKTTKQKYYRNEEPDDNTLTPHIRLVDGRPMIAGAPYLWSIMEAVTSLPSAKIKVPNINKLKNIQLSRK